MATKTATTSQVGDLKELGEIVKNILATVQHISESQGEQLKDIKAAIADLGKAAPAKSRSKAAAKPKDAAFPKNPKAWFIEQYKSEGESGNAFRAKYKTLLEIVSQEKEYSGVSDKMTYAATKIYGLLLKRTDSIGEVEKIKKQFEDAHAEFMSKHGVTEAAAAPRESLEAAAAKPPAKGRGSKKAPAPAAIPVTKDSEEAGSEASDDEVVPKAPAKPKK